MRSLFSFCNTVSENVGIFFLAMMTLIITLQVFCRYVLNQSLAWPEEMSRYCFIWLAYCGFSVATREERHLRIDILLYFLKGKAKETCLLACEVINLIFFSILVYLTWDMMIRVHALEQMAFSFPYPVWMTWFGMFVICILCCISALQTALVHLKNLKS